MYQRWLTFSRIVVVLMAAAVVVGIAGCGSQSSQPPPPPTPPNKTLTSIQITPANPSVAAGSTQQFAAMGTFSDGSTSDLTASVTWTSVRQQLCNHQ